MRILQRTKCFNTEIWDGIYSSFTRRKQAVESFHEETISTLTAAASPAGREVRRSIHRPGYANLTEEPVAHHGHDEHIDDSTESPNDNTSSDAKINLLLIKLTSRKSFIKCNNTSLLRGFK
ncbi:hypothetical protein RO3G_01872 [Rhizopus delemar RA 99-880]|uniref:Uncharacterized protein n=1 Tax=Rhizopus delemar (strain RA 99-880 / ATCC MYA-4621 / FGSC 9543 / NRRL 43880) TaxID=246409 RepID=I1BLT8_RHIO9|nr:hypothetical protein RO3G_01872 [Rhizopus delemar RA 99-880]|eukprot:EIE77168.1 hypothetical protein RO3G_01872 [Rhizopus delemar RA 99-880]